MYMYVGTYSVGRSVVGVRSLAFEEPIRNVPGNDQARAGKEITALRFSQLHTYVLRTHSVHTP